MVLGLLALTLTVFARDIVEFDINNATIWMNPVAWNTFNYDYKIKVIQGFGDTFKQKGWTGWYWTVKEMGTGLKLATFFVSEKGAEKIKILVN
jgi:hypothetical protein